MNMNESVNINKMKVSDLRKFVSSNTIFRGGLSSMKKSEILDRIYASDWYTQNGHNKETEEEVEETEETQPETTETEDVSQTQQENTQQETTEPEINENDAQILQNRLEYLQQQLLQKKNEEDEIQKQISYEQEDERVKEMIQKALENQKRQFVDRFFQ